MALNPQYSIAAVNAEANALSALLDNGYIRIYEGEQPVNADTALLGTEILLAELRFNADAFPNAIDGVLTANPITADASANASGTADFARLLKSDGVTVVMDGTVGVEDANIILPSVDIVIATNVSIPALSVVVAMAGELIEEA